MYVLPPLIDPGPLRRVLQFLYNRIWFVCGSFLLLALLLSLVDLSPDFGSLDHRILGGPPDGNYTALAQQLADRAASDDGRLTVVATDGSKDNVARLAASCDASFGLVQDGMVWPDASGLTVLGRFEKAESVFFLAADADRYRRFADLRGARVGMGPSGSGTAVTARRLLAEGDLAALDVRLESMGYREQLEAVLSGELDLAILVVDEDAEIIHHAIVERGLQPVDFEHIDVVARSLPYAWTGRVAAAQFDPIAVIPQRDLRVLRIGTLLVENGCARRSAIVDMLRVVSDELHGFVAYNRETANRSGLPSNATAETFFQDEGPGFVDLYAPILVDIMPVSNWVWAAFGVSVLLNGLGTLHRYQLWRVDADRNRLKSQIREALGPEVSAADIGLIEPTDAHRREEVVARIALLLERLRALLETCRRRSGNYLVPMGAEMNYRYQEHLIEGLIDGLEIFQSRLHRGEMTTGGTDED